MKLIDKTFVLSTYSGHTGHVKRQASGFSTDRHISQQFFASIFSAQNGDL